MILGYAIPENIEAYASQFPQMTYSPLGRTGLSISQVGFGGYRISDDNNTQREALTQALLNGVNLIDTSSNYGNGGSERLIGEVMLDLIKQGKLSRKQVVIISKGGYLQGENFAISQQRKGENRSWADLVPYSNQLEHCIHPDFLADQITRSLERLQMDTIDVYLLHNPEYYLGWVKKLDVDIEQARVEYERRLELALRHLESEVANGRIRAYGISSNSFPKAPDSYDFTSLEKMLDIAESISADHHFQVIQFPMNVLEPEAAVQPNQTAGQTLLQLAHSSGIGTLVNRPLNAVVGNNLIRLATPPQVQGNPDPGHVAHSIRLLGEQEARLTRAVFGIDIPHRTKHEFGATMEAARLLNNRWSGFGTFSNWRDVRTGYLEPRSTFATRFLKTRPELPPEAAAWVAEYEAAFKTAVDNVTAYYRAQEIGMIDGIRANIGAVDGEWRGAKTISQAAVRALRTTQGVNCVLVGMRTPAYVTDVLTDAAQKITQRPRITAWGMLAEAVSEEE